MSILLIVLCAPILTSILVESDLFIVLSGESDTWIMFFGSYFGAIIGASIVYFVARYQIKKQHNQQIELFEKQNKQHIKSIEIENIQSTKRELKKFYLTNKLNKIEEMFTVLEELSSININLNNDLVFFSVIKQALDENYQSDRKDYFEERLHNLKTELNNHYFKMSKGLTKINVLAEYIRGSKNKIFDLREAFLNLFDQVKECYSSRDKYKQYLKNSESKYTIEDAGVISDLIVDILVNVLHEELKITLAEIESYAKY